VHGPNLDRNRLETLSSAFAGTGDWVRTVDATTAANIAGVPLKEHGLYFRDSRLIDARTVADRLPLSDRIRRCPGTLTAIAPGGDGVQLTLDTGIVDADAVVLCTGCPPALTQTSWLEVLPVAGQLERVRLRHTVAVPIFAEGYLAPRGR
ncbi:MAG: hypothetical protein HC809_17100, partial [Gammaproteobacteria bacterium]|nr:hypothetical protein [Gammaproteobacteria bacterium]